ncbi:terpene cyclase, variant 2 [Taiwanofungus camphoratus]|nr:terpene cyclase, variant 2 [Antrodia cinnamomea]KAI0956433.1 terpene cyclase [Antrodia cinnamomea]
MRPYITVGVAMAVTAYSHLPTVEAKLQIVLYTAILAYLDDPAVFDSLGAGNFHRRLCAGSVQHDTNILGALATNMVEMFACFPRFSASSILTSALRFVNGSMIENTCGGALLSPHSLSFVKYRRELTGIAEAYAAFIWEKSKFPDVGVYIQALPYVMQYLAYANDVMSFYKEELVGEVDNYVHGRAAATGKPVPEAFRDTVDETVAASDRVRTILGEGEARDVWDTFIKGYVYFHIISTRYRLHEILGDQYRWDIDHPTVPKYANSE